jgi:hypothetical protein
MMKAMTDGRMKKVTRRCRNRSFSSWQCNEELDREIPHHFSGIHASGTTPESGV